MYNAAPRCLTDEGGCDAVGMNKVSVARGAGDGFRLICHLDIDYNDTSRSIIHGQKLSLASASSNSLVQIQPGRSYAGHSSTLPVHLLSLAICMLFTRFMYLRVSIGVRAFSHPQT
jgi:hypothetical protein